MTEINSPFLRLNFFPKCQHSVILTRSAMELLQNEDADACTFSTADYFSTCTRVLGGEIYEISELSSSTSDILERSCANLISHLMFLDNQFLVHPQDK